MANYICSIRNGGARPLWVEVASSAPRQAARQAITKAQATGRCRVEVYRGEALPIDLEQSPILSETLIG